MRRRSRRVPPSHTGLELTFREELAAFRRLPRNERLKAVGALLLFLPFLAVVFLVGFFLFGGWAIFDEHLPAWVERLLTLLVLALIAWALLKPVFDRWERSSRD